MATIDEKQHSTAGWLARQVRDTKPDRHAVWNLTGAVGSGKTSVLRLIAESLRAERLIPLTVTAPGGEVDAAPIALLEAASQLMAANLLNGESDILSDPTRRWTDKMDAVTAVVNKHHRDIVVLCDEPTRWYHQQESLLDDTPDFCARSLAEWIAKDAVCRRVITGWVPDDVPLLGRTKSPRLDDGRAFLAENEHWDAAQALADALQQSLSQPVPYRSQWEMRLCVALCRFKPIGDVAVQAASDTLAPVLLEELLDLLEQDAAQHSFCAALARLAIPRTGVRPAIFSELTSDLSPLDRSVIDECLCDWDQARVALHPLVRHEVMNRARDPRRWETNRLWRLPRHERRTVHSRLKDEYPLGNGAAFRNRLESLHHEILGGDAVPSDSDGRLCCVEQLHEIGRTLSHVHHDHRRAVEVFRLALSLDGDHPYSHHYLGFNLDWLAEQPDEVETHYQAAIRLQPTHPWWWSRWISYLATRGRFREARNAWREAIDAMSADEDGTPRWLFLSLHRWVARWLLHWGELDFAEEVLRSIRPEVAESDTSIQTLWNLLVALREAERGAAVFPLTVPASEWWSPNPHTLPLNWQGQPLRSWQPARVEAVDASCGIVHLLAAKRPDTTKSPVEYVEIEFTRNQIDAAAHEFQWSQLCEDGYVELAY
ncbi:MAG: hypothetical protein NTY19_43485 [Planctomycetota bacterium]|nr:hypothetical protein [Planctomycetota bacterium]